MTRRRLLIVVLAVVAGTAALAVPALAKKQQTVIVRIVGGQVAAPGQFPWMAGLVHAGVPRADRGQFCGASVIAPRVVVTAAHCMADELPETMNVVVGRTRMSRGNEGQRVAVSAMLVHPEWADAPTFFNDIALLQLAEPVSVPAIGLPRLEDARFARAPARAVSSGWGTTSEAGSQSNDLLFVSLAVRLTGDCAKRYGSFDPKSQICAGATEGLDTCQGDSGGPLFAGQGTNARLLGLVSYGEGCARKGVPGVYTRVSGFTRWIRENMAALNGDSPPPPEPPDPPRVSIGDIDCGVVMCNVALKVTGRAPAGGILVNVTRKRTSKQRAVDRFARARQLEPGRWTARINLPVGRIILRATPLNANGDEVDGRGAVQRLRITVG
jgi:secreted trypsin-like serine protease